MKNYKFISMLGLLGLSSITLAQADVQWLEAPQKGPLLTQEATKNISKPVNQERTPVAYQYSLIGTAPVVVTDKGYAAESKQYWLNAKAGQLKQGIQLPITSNLAVIRINPLQPDKSYQGINPNQVRLTQFDQDLSVETFVNADQLKATGMAVADNTLAFKVNTVPGLLNLIINDAQKSASDYVINVFEPNSDYSLHLQTQKNQLNSDEAFKVTAQLQTPNGLSAMNIQAYISQPNGEKLADVSFEKSLNGDYTAQLPVLPGRSLAQGLWEIHSVAVSEVNGLKVMRDVSSAFAVEMAVARFTPQLALNKTGLSLGLEVAVEGRYEVSGVLSGFTKEGTKQPIAMVMAAQWLSPGKQAIAVNLPTQLIKQSGLQGPYVLEQMSLKSQSLMVPVQQVDAGIKIRLPERQLADRR